MHVMFHHQNARIALAVVVSVSLMTTGCRSTRNGLSGLPGMSWLAAEEVPSWGSDLEDPGLPPPSSEATPQLTTTNANTNSDSYPDTGYPSPYGEGGEVVRSGGSYPTGHFDKKNAINANEEIEAATVGNTQQGFYGDAYSDGSQSDGSQSAGGDLPSNNRYDQYADSYADQDYASDADPQFERLGDGSQDQAEVDPYERDAHGDLSMPEETGGLRDGYDRFSRGVRDGAEAIADGAERVGDRVQDFARDQGENIRSTVRDGYDRMNLPPNDLVDRPTDDGYTDYPATDSGDPQSTDADSYADEPHTEYPAETASDGYNDYPQDNYDDYPRDTYDPSTDPAVSSPDEGPTASLNPPQSDGYDRSNDVPGVEQGTPRRSAQPWRPGSTGTFRSSGVDPRSSYQDTNAVAPASFPGHATESLVPEGRPNDYPDHGWQSHNEQPAQRLSPTYR